MASYSKAIIKDAIRCGSAPSGEALPRGEYDIDHREGCVGFCNCQDKRAFTLSLDAFIQHLHEGRIALAG
ncbi:hypothetical protein [Hyphococcus sp.]|jgi:hypothetical protein|uniref:hypothetical protein n=1 Tax=Hyphococcus sp. TaxID=2038636 RepID=UPI003D151A6F